MKLFNVNRRRAGGPLTALSTLLVLAASCSQDEIKPRGELMVAVSTDLTIADDMDQVGLQVFSESGQILSSQDLDIKPVGDFGMPGTIALIPPDAGGQRLLVRVSAKHTDGSSQTTSIAREAVVRVPTDRVALLRMPLYWLCKDKVKVAGQTDGKDYYASDCDADQTCQSGVCVKADVSANDMPDYSAALVFGGGNAHGVNSYCLDVESCFGKTEVSAKPSADDCSLPLPAGVDPNSLNVALVLPPNTDGYCLDDPVLGRRQGNCYIPLDQDPDGPTDGYAIQNRRIVMPPQACIRASVQGIAVSTSCQKKDLSVPICGPWLGWDTMPGSTGGTGGTSGNLGGEGNESGSSNAGENSVGQGGSGVVATGGTQSTTAGEGGEAGMAPSADRHCPIAAVRANSYYYVLLDRSESMQPSLSGIGQALLQFGTQSQSAGVEFGLELSQDECQGDYSQPTLNFNALPNAVEQLPNLQASAQPKVQLDDAMAQTFQTLESVSGPVSRTLVVITSGFDAPGTLGCATLTDVMQQVVEQALSEGISVRPVIVTSQNQPNLTQGFQVNGAPQPVQLSGTNFQPSSLVSALASFRDAVVPCTFVAPSAGAYAVSIQSSDGSSRTLSNVGSASACGSTLGYYASGSTVVLCPSACTAIGSGTVETDDFCVNEPSGTGGTSSAGGQRNSGGTAGRNVAGAPGTGGTTGIGASPATGGTSARGTAGAAGTGNPAGCPATEPNNGDACTGSATCTYGTAQCFCKAGWTCTG